MSGVGSSASGVVEVVVWFVIVSVVSVSGAAGVLFCSLDVCLLVVGWSLPPFERAEQPAIPAVSPVPRSPSTRLLSSFTTVLKTLLCIR